MAQWDPDMEGVVEFPDGTRVRGRGMARGVPATSELPDFGVYLLTKPPNVFWDHRWVRWPDFWLPRSSNEAVTALQEGFSRAARNRVEVACAGGKGRTGTALALMAVMAGVPAGDAVGWVREHYRTGAVETPWQRRWVSRYADSVG